jgi:hypothetical protein
MQPYTHISQLCQSKLCSLSVGDMGWKAPTVMQALTQEEKHCTTGTKSINSSWL